MFYRACSAFSDLSPLWFPAGKIHVPAGVYRDPSEAVSLFALAVGKEKYRLRWEERIRLVPSLFPLLGLLGQYVLCSKSSSFPPSVTDSPKVML
ncbi:hypothetical protein LY76DRAFT_204141 [Colletotrichum caudatum]|nr:hypothetical protein LY76DRAFT_204141 [Colletotrichum caudatum]